ncbi:hypothetical protein [Alteromonas sp. C1M14]|uniref:ComF family protein n=1 Tax=Alteromonas sp. C1M14 TaxID=2841567 RepID=UPI001C08F81D|nr:hypothetical protein [Alteromonas sp. C1M14]MBU2978362.1 hypothetical protein [Alteromonas sp. C1M14]
MELPNFACLLCQQYSDHPICEYCKTDTCFLANAGYKDNLLFYPQISRQFRHSGYHTLYACGEYQWPFTDLIHRMKFHRCLTSARILANWFVEFCIHEDTLLPDCLLPVPVHFRRFVGRRFNQAAVIARHIGNQIDRPVCYNWAHRHGGKAQHTLTRSQRLLNLRSAFTTSITADYHHVAIIDDVLTTGVTADVLAKQLRTQQPGLIIDVWVIALSTQKPLVQRTKWVD